MEALARAKYEQLRASDTSNLLKKLIGLLTSRTNRDSRLFGAYGLFLLVLDNHSIKPVVLNKLKALSASPEPQQRIAAVRTLEMLSISDLSYEVKSDKTKYALNKAKLEFLFDYGEPHIQFAAQVSLEEF